MSAANPPPSPRISGLNKGGGLLRCWANFQNPRKHPHSFLGALRAPILCIFTTVRFEIKFIQLSKRSRYIKSEKPFRIKRVFLNQTVFLESKGFCNQISLYQIKAFPIKFWISAERSFPNQKFFAIKIAKILKTILFLAVPRYEKGFFESEKTFSNQKGFF